MKDSIQSEEASSPAKELERGFRHFGGEYRIAINSALESCSLGGVSFPWQKLPRILQSPLLPEYSSEFSQLRKLYQFSLPQGIKIRKHIVHQRANISVNRHNGSICSCFALLHTLQEKYLQKRVKNTHAVACFYMGNDLHRLKLQTVCK